MNEVKQRAAFIYLGNGRYSEAEALLVECGADPREVGVCVCVCVCSHVTLL